MEQIDIPYTNQNTIDLFKLKRHFMRGGFIKKSSILSLFQKAKEILKKEKNVVEVEDNCLVFGDFHGHYFDFMTQIEDHHYLEQPTFVFLGDYVDRGKMSCEIVFTLLSMKLNNPNKIVMLRGNHESASMTKSFGFIDECKTKYGEDIYKQFLDLFNHIPLCALLKINGNNFFCSHGGISPNLNLIEEINQIDRFVDVPFKGLFCDLLWSDPIDNDFFNKNPDFRIKKNEMTFVENASRGCSYQYGIKAVKDFLKHNNLKCMIRAHQCCDDGIKMMRENGRNNQPICITIFSATEYLYNNHASNIYISKDVFRINKYQNPICDDEYKPNIENAIDFTFNNLSQSIPSLIKDIVLKFFMQEYEEKKILFEKQNTQNKVVKMIDTFKPYQEKKMLDEKMKVIEELKKNALKEKKDISQEPNRKRVTRKSQSGKSSKRSLSISMISINNDDDEENDDILAPLSKKHDMKTRGLRYNKEKKRQLHRSICTNAPTIYEKHITLKDRADFIPLTLNELRDMLKEVDDKIQQQKLESQNHVQFCETK